MANQTVVRPKVNTSIRAKIIASAAHIHWEDIIPKGNNILVESVFR